MRGGVQVRIEGPVAIVDDAEADAYFATRPRGSQLGAWASKQSGTLLARADFDARIAELEREFAGRDVPRPPRWTGLRVKPEKIEIASSACRATDPKRPRGKRHPLAEQLNLAK